MNMNGNNDELKTKISILIKKWPLFLQIYFAIVLFIIFNIINIFKWVLYIGIAMPLFITGILLYVLIVKPIKWIFGLFIKIESVDIYE